ncbi:MAG TPA: hypothetical protein VMH38_08370 [Thermoplasmata archaeon]|nr:hypothetical protein [Thermoplasmata archaeon]
MAGSRPIRIARPERPAPKTPALEAGAEAETVPPSEIEEPREVRANRGGGQRALRVTLIFVIVLAAMYLGFALYDRSAPGGSASPESNGLLLFTGVFVVIALVGVVYSLSPAPRRVEVGTSGLTVVGRWGRRRPLPPVDRLSVRLVRRYPPGLLSNATVELVEVWGDGAPVRTYLIEEGLFSGATPVER